MDVKEAWLALSATLGDRCDWCDPHGDIAAPWTDKGRERVATLPRDSRGHPHEIDCKWLQVDKAVLGEDDPPRRSNLERWTYSVDRGCMPMRKP